MKENPPPSSTAAHNRMKAVKSSGTAAEVGLRRALAELGLQFELNARPLPDHRFSADMLFRQARLAVFVDGCFWHGCPVHGTTAKSNAGFWADKIEANKARDKRVSLQLAERNWQSLRMWEHEDPEMFAALVAKCLPKRS